MKNIEKVVAVKAVKTYPKEEVGSLRKVGESEDGLMAGFTPEREIEFVSEEDFEEPARENF